MKSVICAIVKNEQRFIREWVEHYLNIGFDKLYIFEDYGSDTHYEQIKDYIKDNKVILNSLDKTHYIKRYKKGTSVQRNLYLKFLMECKKTHNADWIGFFDVDEFMFFEDGWNLEKLENEFKDHGGLRIRVHFFFVFVEKQNTFIKVNSKNKIYAKIKTNVS